MISIFTQNLHSFPEKVNLKVNFAFVRKMWVSWVGHFYGSNQSHDIQKGVFWLCWYFSASDYCCLNYHHDFRSSKIVEEKAVGFLGLVWYTPEIHLPVQEARISVWVYSFVLGGFKRRLDLLPQAKRSSLFPFLFLQGAFPLVFKQNIIVKILVRRFDEKEQL